MELDVADLDALALGCELLGAGGGGATSTARLIAAHHLALSGPVPVVDLEEAPPRIAVVGAVGASTLMLEDLPGPHPFARAVEALAGQVGSADALMPLEVGGVNGLLALVAASHLGLPLVDADPHGRAYTWINRSVLGVRHSPTSLAFSSTGGEVAWFDAPDGAGLERLVRSILPAVGGWGAIAWHLDAAAACAAAVRGTPSRALSLGRLLREACAGRPNDLLGRPDLVQRLDGTVVEVARRSAPEPGGVASILDRSGTVSVRLDFANEFVGLYRNGEPVCAVPDLICVVDAQSWLPIPVDRIAAMQRVRVLTIDAAPELQAAQRCGAHFGLASHGYVEVS